MLAARPRRAARAQLDLGERHHHAASDVQSLRHARASLDCAAMRAAVVGHVEWIEFAAVPAMPGAGDIVHAREVWEEPGGGGAVAAVQLAKLAGEATLYTALGDDELGHRAKRELEAHGLRVEATFRPEPQRRAFVHVDDAGERTITVIGDRLGPRADDPLPVGRAERHRRRVPDGR